MSIDQTFGFEMAQEVAPHTTASIAGSVRVAFGLELQARLSDPAVYRAELGETGVELNFGASLVRTQSTASASWEQTYKLTHKLGLCPFEDMADENDACHPWIPIHKVLMAGPIPIPIKVSVQLVAEMMVDVTASSGFELSFQYNQFFGLEHAFVQHKACSNKNNECGTTMDISWADPCVVGSN